jgi:hypothetical protein
VYTDHKTVRQTDWLPVIFIYTGWRKSYLTLDVQHVSSVKRLSPQECLRFLITKGLITPARYLNFHLNFVHNYGVFLVQQLTLAEHSHSSRALFDSIRNTRSLTYLYQKDEQLFLGPLRTTHL